MRGLVNARDMPSFTNNSPLQDSKAISFEKQLDLERFADLKEDSDPDEGKSGTQALFHHPLCLILHGPSHQGKLMAATAKYHLTTEIRILPRQTQTLPQLMISKCLLI